MSHAPTAALDRRYRILRADLEARALDALIVTSRPNVLYLTNFTGSAAIAIVTAERVYFATDFRYLTAINDARGLPHECPRLELVRVDGSYDATLARLIESACLTHRSRKSVSVAFAVDRIASGLKRPSQISVRRLASSFRACASVVDQVVGPPARTSRARMTFARMSRADFVQMNGLGFWLCPVM